MVIQIFFLFLKVFLGGRKKTIYFSRLRILRGAKNSPPPPNFWMTHFLPRKYLIIYWAKTSYFRIFCHFLFGYLLFYTIWKWFLSKKCFSIVIVSIVFNYLLGKSKLFLHILPFFILIFAILSHYLQMVPSKELFFNSRLCINVSSIKTISMRATRS